MKDYQYSFDVFDTCLSRLCGEPQNAFYLIALKLLGGEADQSLIYEFVNARKRAEKKALCMLKSPTKQDVTLDDIYSCFDTKIFKAEINQLVKLELEIENKVLRPIYSAKNAISKIHGNDKRIIYISDTYLPALFIRYQLQKYGFWQEGDTLYVSSESGRTKNSGGLYDYIAEKERISLIKWRHYGNNLISDYRIPHQKGIRAALLKNDEYSRYELSWISSSVFEGKPLTSILMAGIARSVRITSESLPTKDIVVDIIAPLFIPFVVWVLKDAQKRGINHLFFMARDGYIFFKIAQIVGLKFPRISCSYLYGSRRALYLAGLRGGSLDEFRWIMGGAIGKTPRQMMKQINLDVDVLEPSIKVHSLSINYYDEIINKNTFELFLRLLVDKSVIHKILDEADKQKEIALNYFIQEGLLDSGRNIALVDLGWTRNCQNAIANITNREIYGYYFGVFEERMSIDRGGDYSACFYPEEIVWSRRLQNILFGSFISIAEQIFAMTDQGSTIGYESKGSKIIPILAERENNTAKSNIFLKHLYQYIETFTLEYSEFDLLMDDPKQLVKKCGFSSSSLFLEEPRRREVLVLKDFEVGNNLDDNKRIVVLVSPIVLIRFLLSKLSLLNGYSHSLVWAEGSFTYTFGGVGRILLKIINNVGKRIFKKPLL